MYIVGMKICGGRDENGNHTGIFVKQILENGLAAKSGDLFPAISDIWILLQKKIYCV